MSLEDCTKYSDAVKNTDASTTILKLVLTPFDAHPDFAKIVKKRG